MNILSAGRLKMHNRRITKGNFHLKRGIIQRASCETLPYISLYYQVNVVNYLPDRVEGQQAFFPTIVTNIPRPGNN